MKKTNKILTRALVILLALVLITSSVVSSTFAKYVVRRSASTTVELQKFGLLVKLNHSDELSEHTDTEVKGDSVTYKLNNVTLTPGNTDYLNALTASIEGESSVDAWFSISVVITCNDTRFTLSNENFNKLAAVKDEAKVYNPIAFYVGSDTTNAVNSVYSPLDTTTDNISIKNDVEQNIINKIKTKVNTQGAFESVTIEDNNTIIGNIKKDTQVNLTDIGLGFMWADTPTDTSVTCWDEIATWISSSSAMTTDETTQFSITYTISVEQGTKPTA